MFHDTKTKEDGSYDFDSAVPAVIGENGATEIFTDNKGAHQRQAGERENPGEMGTQGHRFACFVPNLYRETEIIVHDEPFHISEIDIQMITKGIAVI